MEPAASIEVTVTDECTTIAIVGEIDESNAYLLADAVAAAIETAPREIEIDCAAMTFMDSAGLRVLINAWQQLRDRATMDIFVTNLQRGPQRMLDLAGVSGLLTR